MPSFIDGSHTASPVIYTVQRLRRPIPSCSGLPPARRSRPVSSPRPTPPNPALICASAERAKPNVLP
eukprot:scaffold82318_cov60-Phaeocystis_antarctica.AAC.2